MHVYVNIRNTKRTISTFFVIFSSNVPNPLVSHPKVFCNDYSPRYTNLYRLSSVKKFPFYLKD